ncbi:MAG: apolipoprotein N-acyltransferase [Candidatus Firestonebacteria bacterium]
MKIILAILSGFLLILSFPNFLSPNFSPISGVIAWVSLIPLLFAIKDSKLKESYVLGFISGMVCFLGGLYWITNIKELGSLSFLCLGFLSLYLASYIGIFAVCVNFSKTLFIAPFIWVSLEFIRSHFLTGFPWFELGYSQYLNLPILQTASISSVYGISFIICFVNVCEVSLLNFLFFKHKSDSRYNTILFSIGSILIIFLCLYGYSNYNLTQREFLKSSEQKRVNITLLQGNIDQSVKWEVSNLKDSFDIYKDLAKISSIHSTSGNLVVWPETALPIYLKYEPEYLSKVINLTNNTKNYMLIGALDAKIENQESNIKNQKLNDEKRNEYFNTAFLFAPDKGIIDKYYKIHLVPFGEYVPLVKFVTFLEKYTSGFSNYSSGKEITTLNFEPRFSVLICYEIIFSELVRKFVNSGAKFIVNITNDAWYGKSAMPYQHVSIVPFRAVENRVWIARSANTGISCFVNPLGEFSKKTDIFVKGSITENINIFDCPTFYKRYGDIFAFFCIFVVLIVLVICLIKET